MISDRHALGISVFIPRWQRHSQHAYHLTHTRTQRKTDRGRSSVHQFIHLMEEPY